jgi:hypothetical protein
MEPKLVGILALVGGLALAALGIFADMLGIGSTRGIIGGHQFISIASGAILFMLGFTILLMISGNPKNGNT